jgi:dihydroorotate dehydrogenase (fumarate)
VIDLSKTIDLSTTYLGLKLKNPLVASSSPMCEDVDNIRRIEDSGAGAVVLHSLFEEQIEHESDELDRFMTESSGSAESVTHFPELTHRVMGPDGYLAHIVKCKQAVRIPVIASLNGTTQGGWLRYARQMEQAGADALELNIYHIPVDPDVAGEQVEQRYVDLVKAVKSEVRIPVAV